MCGRVYSISAVCDVVIEPLKVELLVQAALLIKVMLINFSHVNQLKSC